MSLALTPIGYFHTTKGDFSLHIEPPYLDGLSGLEDFSHVVVIFGFDRSPEFSAKSLICEHPYPGGPSSLGVFATRAPHRPNQLGIMTGLITDVDLSKGAISVAFHDALDGSPIYDMKPYTPSLDRVEEPRTPRWAAGWPGSVEESGTFDWSSVFPSPDTPTSIAVS